ncbi:MAG: hypothetical protein U1D30_05780 [Planctomycetota bacterium]
MNATAIMLVAAALTCPWSKASRWSSCEPTVIYLPCTPTYVPCTPAPVAVTPQVAEVVAETQPDPTVAENVAATEEEKDAVESVKAEEEIVTEPVAFGYPSALSLGHMALDWGVATIGAGTLMPTTPYVGSYGRGFPRGGFGNGNGSVSDPTDNINDFPTIINQITIINNNNNSPGPSPVPEPASVLVWMGVLVAVGYFVHRRRPIHSANAAAAQ